MWPRCRRREQVLFKTFAASDLALVPAGYAMHCHIDLPSRTSVLFEHRLSRMLDVAVAMAALIFFAPLMLIITAAIWSSGGPVLFRHQRVGRNGRLFSCLKFRTMHVHADDILADLLERDPVARAEWLRDHKLRRDPRVGRVGAFLRKTSLDELPQVFNVLGGTMGIVGPRPIVPAEADRYRRYFDLYCQVRPGITGLWQISGRNTTTYRRRVACDVAYIRTKSPVRDMQIIFRTVPAVVLRRGAY